MLRIFIDSNNEARNILEDKVNIQVTSFSKIFLVNGKISNFQNLINKYLMDNDEVIIITSFKSKKLIRESMEIFNSDSKLKIIDSNLVDRSLNLLIKTIIENRNKSPEEIVLKINNLFELFELAYYLLMDR